MSWMRLLFERNGGWMPHKTQVHLPTSSSKKLFYIRMLKELEDDLGIKKEDNISYEYFTEIWRQHLPEFVIPKKQEFVKCNICVQLREDLARAKTAMERGEIKDLIDKHVQQVEIERRVYHNTREQARTESDEVMCVIQDGMDQAKTSIPHLVEPDKLTALLARIRLHLTGYEQMQLSIQQYHELEGQKSQRKYHTHQCARGQDSTRILGCLEFSS
ncbi:uncharacterized protein [Ptychodera flava]|uniref:uncharacterized protein isoform X2 n=1 Tax=Ptychodera flava TaxID=63121 RepID=UPI00396A59CF